MRPGKNPAPRSNQALQHQHPTACSTPRPGGCTGNAGCAPDNGSPSSVPRSPAARSVGPALIVPLIHRALERKVTGTAFVIPMRPPSPISPPTSAGSWSKRCHNAQPPFRARPGPHDLDVSCATASAFLQTLEPGGRRYSCFEVGNPSWNAARTYGRACSLLMRANALHALRRNAARGFALKSEPGLAQLVYLPALLPW